MEYGNFTYGKMLKEVRGSLNISQKTMAKKLNISRGYVSEIETGAKKPSFQLCVKIRSLHLKHCLFIKPEPLVDVMKPKLSWIKRLIGWIKEK